MTTHTNTPSSDRFRLWFWLVGIVLFFVFLSLIKGILLPFVVGILAAYFLDPAVSKLHECKWSRTMAAAVITVLFFVGVIALGIVLVPLIVHQLSLLIADLPDYIRKLEGRYDNDIQYYLSVLGLDQEGSIHDVFANFGGTLMHWAGSVATGAVASGFAFFNIVLLFFITPVVAFYLLRDWDKLVAQIDHLLPRASAQTIREQLHEMDRTLSGFIRGQTNVCLIMATFYGIALSLAGLKFGLVIGIMTGVLLFVPFVGYATGLTLSMIIALIQFDSSAQVLVVLGIFLVGQIMEGSLITPKLVGSKVGLHPLWIIFGMLSGAALFGFVGILIAVPVTAVTGVLVRFAITRYLQSPLYGKAK